MLVNGSAIMKPANSGRFSDSQLANAIKVPAIAALNKKSMSSRSKVLKMSTASKSTIFSTGLLEQMRFAVALNLRV